MTDRLTPEQLEEIISEYVIINSYGKPYWGEITYHFRDGILTHRDEHTTHKKGGEKN